VSNHHYLLIFLWSAFILFIGLTAEQSILAHDEGLYATRAKIMFETGDWVNPWELPHHKPPGTYWLIALMYHLGGVNEIVLRSPNLILAIGCAFLVYEISKSLFDQTIALSAALILNLEFLWVKYSYLANPDHPTIFLFLLAIWGLLKYQDRLKQQIEDTNQTIFLSRGNSTKYLFIFGTCLSFMIVFRGFYALMLILSLTPYLFITNRTSQHFKKISLYLGLILGLSPFLIWLYLNFQRFDVKSFQALIDLFVNLSQEERQGNKQFYYIWNTLSLCFPWIIFSGIGFITEFKKSNYPQKLLSIGVPSLIFIMITLYETRISHYALSLYPFLAILASLGIHFLLRSTEDSRIQKIQNRTIQAISYFLMVIGSLAFLAGLICLFFGKYLFSDVEFTRYIYIAFPIALSWMYLGICIYKKYSKTSWLISLLLGQWLTMVLLNSSGLMTDINPEFKKAMLTPEVQRVVQSNSVALLGDGKQQVLLRFYTPVVNYRINTFDEIKIDHYVWMKETDLPQNANQYQIISTYEELRLIQKK
jgi:4-amino-4-deoxy-L-arabinose transferase-like glycosyltransferase